MPGSRETCDTTAERNPARRNIGLGTEIAQHGRELRQHGHKKEQHDAASGDQHENRVLHRIGELATHGFRSHPLSADHLKDVIEGPGDFADPDQGDIHGWKQRRMTSEHLGETFSGKDAGTQLVDDRTQPSDVGVVGQKFERIFQPGARLHQ